jgi:hypothetical protein
MCQISRCELSLFDPCIDLCVDFVEGMLEIGIDGVVGRKCSDQAWAQEAIVGA